MRCLIILLGVIFMGTAEAGEFTIKSDTFVNNSRIPAKYSCDGNDISPPLAWSGAPENTQSFALICSDPDAPSGTWYHWVVFDIPKNTLALTENMNPLPAGSIAAENSWKRERYNGPCPPKGSTHHYIFTIYALDAKLDLSSHIDAETLINAMNGHVLMTTQITGLFGH